MTSTPGASQPLQQRVSAILVSHNGARWLPEVVAALSSQERAPDFLCAVDTGSRDGSVELLRNSRIDVIETAPESGFGAAVALAVAQLPEIPTVVTESGEVVERETEWLWLLHDDCAPAPDALAQLLTAVAERPNVGVAGPKILGWHDRTHLLEIGVTIAHNGSRWTGLERNERDQGQHDGDGALPVLAVSTAGALIRRDLFEEIGGFDENLPLFRDDVDFGMRAHMAGYTVICVTGAKLFHAEAAATERRAIDVAGGTFHRPHLLDKRHAAFVLLANLPLWTLPWITLRIFASSVIRAIGYLLAKLPGYALDEVAAVALLFTRLDRLRVARQARRKKRLLPARVIRPLLAPWSEQLKLGALRVRDLLLRRIERVPEPVLGNVFTESDDSFEGELLAPSEQRMWRHTLTRPLLVAMVPLLLLSLVAARSRFGSLVGGALAQVGNSAFLYLQIYGQSWHPLGVGSSRPSHPFTAFLGLASLATGGNPALLVSLLFIFSPALALLTMYYFVRKNGGSRWIAAATGVIYGCSALLLTSIDVGYVSTVILIVVLPLFVLVARPLLASEYYALSWRRVCVIALSLILLSALSFQIFVAMVIFLGVQLWLLRRDRTALIRQAPMFLTIAMGGLLGLAPWSLNNLLHPADLFADQGVPLPLASPIHALLGNMQPLSSAPMYVMSFTTIVALVALFSQRAVIDSIAIFASLLLAAFMSAFALPVSGASVESHLWPGGFLALSIFFSGRAFALLSQGRLKRLQSAPLGRAHFATLAVALFALYCVCANLFWWVSSPSSSPVKTVQNSVLPAFISTATVNPDRPKTLILRGETINGVQRFSYVILRERDPFLGEVSSAPNEVALLTKTVSEIASGAGEAPAATLGEFGIRYLYLENGRTDRTLAALARKIDGIGGLARLSATPEGILWEVSGLTSRIRFISNEKGSKEVEVPAEAVGAEFDVPSAGVVKFAEMYDPRWRALHGGKVLLPKKSELGLTEFSIPEGGRVVLFHDGTVHRAGISLQLAAIGLLIFFALPRGRRQSELLDEEVA